MNNLIVVSGGTKGIGRAIVEKFLESGFDAVICARKESELLSFEQEALTMFPTQKVYVFKADLSKKIDCDRFVAFIQKLKQPLTILVNNAGLFLPGQVHSEPEGTLQTMIETNLYSAYNLTRGLVANMIENKKGHIFNICSTASITAYTNGGSYCISKFAMLGMTKVLREELKPIGIKVTAILPGATRTASWDGVADELPEDRLMDPADVAEMVFAAYSLSPKAVVEEILLRPQLGDL